MTSKSPMDAAMDVWLERNPGQAAPFEAVDLMRAVLVAVQPLIRRRAFADAATELRTHAKEVWQTDQQRSLGISDAAALLVGWAERGDTA